MEWTPLTTEAQLTEIVQTSETKPQVIFKHSTRCSISAVAWQRLRKATPSEGLDYWYLDLLSLSNKIAETFAVHHESPQVLVIKNGECVFDESHLAISMSDIAEQATF